MYQNHPTDFLTPVTNLINLFTLYRPVETAGVGGLQAPQILAKVDLLSIDDNSEK